MATGDVPSAPLMALDTQDGGGMTEAVKEALVSKVAERLAHSD